jgi:hypothetical protein
MCKVNDDLRRQLAKAQGRLEKIGRCALGFSRSIDPSICGSDRTLAWLDWIHRLATEADAEGEKDEESKPV